LLGALTLAGALSAAALYHYLNSFPAECSDTLRDSWGWCDEEPAGTSGTWDTTDQSSPPPDRAADQNSEQALARLMEQAGQQNR
jgi:hypothetical protein